MPLPLRYTGLIRLQDPLLALDTHVGEAVFNTVLLHSSSGSTRILVTHALHFLPRVDYIYFIVDGRIAERGTFDEMMANRGGLPTLLTNSLRFEGPARIQGRKCHQY